jgi:hypothetical protein
MLSAIFKHRDLLCFLLKTVEGIIPTEGGRRYNTSIFCTAAKRQRLNEQALNEAYACLMEINDFSYVT